MTVRGPQRAEPGEPKVRMSISVTPRVKQAVHDFAKDNNWSDSNAAAWLIEKAIKDTLQYIDRTPLKARREGKGRRKSNG